ncbi:SBBP repeat-containing protein [Chloroflexota bacterium]
MAKVKANPTDRTPEYNFDYCGYIGGSGYDYGYGIAVDGSDCAYVTGYTSSNEATEGFPVAVGPDLTFNGDHDAFVAKVKANPADPTPWNNFDYCGYIGGSHTENGYGIAVDGSGCAYVTGYTDSDETTQGFPVAVGPDLTFNSGNDAFVAKVWLYNARWRYCRAGEPVADTGTVAGACGANGGGFRSCRVDKEEAHSVGFPTVVKKNRGGLPYNE